MVNLFKVLCLRWELASAVRVFTERLDHFDCDFQLAAYLCPPLPEMRSRCEAMHRRLRQIDRECPENLWVGRNQINLRVSQ